MRAAPFPPPFSDSVLAEAGAAALALMRRDEGDEPALVARLAGTALELAEQFCGRALIARAREDVLVAVPGWQKLAAAPVTSIAGVTALPVAGAPAVLAADRYAVDIDADGIGWVRIGDAGGAGRVAVSYTAGLAVGWDALPPPIAQGVAMLAAHLFEHREDDRAPPAAVAALWRPWRVMRLTGVAR